MSSSVGRNEPCPCGSGRKFKRCHGVVSDVVPSQEQRTQIAQRLVRALNEEGRAALEESFTQFMAPLDRYDPKRIAPLLRGEQTESAIVTYALYDLLDEEGRSFTQRFIARRGGQLGTADLAFIEKMLASLVDFWEVRRVELDRGIVVRNLRNGSDLFVHERSATKTVVEYHVLAARVVEVEPGRFEFYPPVLLFDQESGRGALANVRATCRRVRAKADLGLGLRDLLKLGLPWVHAAWVESRFWRRRSIRCKPPRGRRSRRRF